MNPKPMLYALGTCVLAATMAAGAEGSSWFEARTTGAKVLVLRGSAEFGWVTGDAQARPFVLTLGADSPTGAVVFTSRNGDRPGPGVYDLTEGDAGGIQALVVTGSPSQPTGVFRARAGKLTITRSRPDFIAGHFQIDAAGFEAATPMNEDRELAVRGAFTATHSRF